MSGLKVLFLGGSGVISTACAWEAVERGLELHVLNRGVTRTRPLPPEVRVLTADVRDRTAVAEAIGDQEYDAVVDWVAFTPDHVRTDVDLFEGRTGQYVFISSASAYQTPPTRLPIVESTPLRNPFWQYSRDKIACEDLLVGAYRDSAFPVTVVRPSHTYDRTLIPLDGGWTALARMRAGKPVIVHVPSDAIAAEDAEWGAGLLGDKTHCMVFDNSKLRSVVPDYRATIPFEQGAREIVEWHDADVSRRQVNAEIDAVMDRLVERYRVG